MVLTEIGLAKVFQRVKSFVIAQLNSKASVLHTHTYSEIVDLPNGIAVDSTLDGTSSNAIANNAVSNALDGKSNTGHTHSKSEITDFPSLATVSTSGSYNDLSNKPTIPTNTNELANDAGFVTKNDVLNLIYPVGSIYLSVNSVDPSTIFGGTWEQIKDTFLLSSGDTYSIGSTGGEATHTLTIDEMPSHNHSAISSSDGDHNHSLVSITGTDDLNFINGTNEFLIQNSDTTMGWSQSVNTSLKYGSTGNAGSHSHSLTVNSTGGSQPHNNMPPYLTINVWKRVA